VAKRGGMECGWKRVSESGSISGGAGLPSTLHALGLTCVAVKPAEKVTLQSTLRRREGGSAFRHYGTYGMVEDRSR
jgi:hypothetical protein